MLSVNPEQVFVDRIIPPQEDDMNQAKWALMYAKDLSIPPGGSTGNTEMVEFRSFFGLMWFVIRDKIARAAVTAGRVRVIKIVDKPQGA